MVRNLKNIMVISALTASMLLTAACSGGGSSPAPTSEGNNPGATASASPAAEKKLSGEIVIDGSSTVFPITQAIAEEFNAVHRDVKIPVGVSGTGGGFKKFTIGEIDIADASRPIKDSEKEEAAKNGIEYVEILVAYDGIAVMVNKDNSFLENITAEELKKIWEPNSTVKTWKDVNPAWPAEEIKLYGPGTDSGTFEYFTEAINGKAMDIRKEFTASEDDNILVKGIAGDKNSMGYFGFAYYLENQDTLKALGIDAGKGAVKPSLETIKDGSYSPLSRPLFIYVNKKALAEKEEVKEFVKFYLENAKDLVASVGYVPVADEEYTKGLDLVK